MTRRTVRPRRSLLRRWLRKVWWVQPRFNYPVRWWNHLDRLVCYTMAIILAIHALLGQYIELFELFCL